MRLASWHHGLAVAATTVLGIVIPGPAAFAAPAPPAAAGPVPAAVSAPTQVASAACPAAGTSRPSVPAGTGNARGATFATFPLTDRTVARVNVGSGNLLLETTELVLPGVNGDVALGATYNSLLVGSGVAQGAFGPGWRTATGVDARLYPAADGSVTYVAPSGVTGVFLPAGATGYTSPAEFKATLVKTGTGWELTTHETGARTVFTGDGRPDQIRDRNGNVTDLAYSAPGVSSQIVSTRGSTGARTAAVTVDASCRITSYAQTGDVTRTAVYTYGGAAVTGITTAAGRRTTLGYDAAGNLTSLVFADAAGVAVGRVAVTYDSAHRVTSVKRFTDLASGAGAVTRFAYPSATQTLVAGPNTDQAQPVTSVPRTTYTVNGGKRVTRTVDPAGRTRDATYNPFSDVASATTAAGTTTFGYSTTVNNGASLTSVTHPSGATTSLAYGNSPTPANPTAAYQPVSGTDSQGNTNLFTYTGAGNLAATTDASAATAQLTYNADGTPATSTDPGNGTNRTVYTYDTGKNLTTVTPVTGSSLAGRTFTYDSFSRLRSTMDGRSVVTTYTYDRDDRLTGVSYSDGTPAVQYTYDAAGNVTRRTDGTGTTDYRYDPLNRLTSRTAASGGGTLEHGYDLAGNLTRATDARGTTTMAYDSAGLQTSLTTAKGTVVRYAYDTAARRVDTWFGVNAAGTTWTAHTHTDYDRSGRVARTWTATNSNNANRVYDTSWCYSAYTGAACPTASAPTDRTVVQWRVDNLTSVRTTYTYDGGNRLTKATASGGKTYTYTYDARGNRLTAADGTTTQTLTYNAANQITSPGYTYDAAGNQIGDPSAGALFYNGAGQLAARSSSSFPYTYAGTGQAELVRQVLADGTTLGLVYGRADQFGRPLLQSLTRPGVGTTYLDHDARGNPQVLTTAAGAETFYVLDNLGAPVRTVGTGGTVTGTYTYDPYGVATATDSTNANPYRFAAGGVHDRDTGLVRYGARWYNPATGRFTQQDSVERLGDLREGNRYAYAACNPVTYIDPTGRSIFSCLAVGAAAIGSFLGGAAAVATGAPAAGAAITGIAAATGITAGAWLGVGAAVFGFAAAVLSVPDQCFTKLEFPV